MLPVPVDTLQTGSLPPLPPALELVLVVVVAVVVCPGGELSLPEEQEAINAAQPSAASNVSAMRIRSSCG